MAPNNFKLKPLVINLFKQNKTLSSSQLATKLSQELNRNISDAYIRATLRRNNLKLYRSRD